ncbi:MAG: cytochrome c-type biogenesis protein CcmH [Patulibacter minatonensis]
MNGGRLRRLLAALLLALSVGTALAPAALANVDPADLEDEVMCVVCGRPLSTSSGRAADDQRQVIQGFIDEGLSKDQIKARLVDEYGERVLVDDRSGIAAAAPWIAAIVGLTSIGLLLRSRRQRGESPAPAPANAATPDAPAAAAVPVVSADDDARIDAELAERG